MSTFEQILIGGTLMLTAAALIAAAYAIWIMITGRDEAIIERYQENLGQRHRVQDTPKHMRFEGPIFMGRRIGELAQRRIPKVGIVGGVAMVLHIVYATLTGSASPSPDALGIGLAAGGILIVFLSISISSTARAVDRAELHIREVETLLSQRIEDLQSTLANIVDLTGRSRD